MSIKTAIKKAAAAVQAAVLPHENPSPVAETTVAQVIPVPPEEDSGAHAAHEAGRIHRKLTEQRVGEQDCQKLDQGTRQAIIRSLNFDRHGKPRIPPNAFLENEASGALFTLEGKPADLGQERVDLPVRIRDTRSDEDMTAVYGHPAEVHELSQPDEPAVPQPVTQANRRRTRAEYLEYKRKRKERGGYR